MRALHVVGENLELGLQVHRRGAVEQQAAQGLLPVGLLREARDLDRGGEAGAALIGGDRAPHLTRRAVGLRVVDADGAFLRLGVAGEQRAAIFGEGALARHRQLRVDAAALPARAEEGGNEARRLAHVGLLAQRHEAGGLEQADAAHQPRTLAKPGAGVAIGPASAHERLDHFADRVLGQHDLGGEMVLARRGDVDDLHRIGGGLRVEAERPAGARVAAERVVAARDLAQRHRAERRGGLVEHAVDEQQPCTGQVEKVVLGPRDGRERRGGGQRAEIGPAPRLGAAGGKFEGGHRMASAAGSGLVEGTCGWRCAWGDPPPPASPVPLPVSGRIIMPPPRNSLRALAAARVRGRRCG